LRLRPIGLALRGLSQRERDRNFDSFTPSYGINLILLPPNFSEKCPVYGIYREPFAAL